MTEPTGSKRTRPVLVVLAIFGAVLFITALVAEAVVHTSIDPTEQAFSVTLHNDTSRPVVAEQCDATCSSFHEQDRLPAGASVPVNTSSDDVANWWTVTDASGTQLGCLSLRYRHKIQALVVNVSSYIACPPG